MKVQNCDVAVVGGGLHGLSVALHLARRNCRVALIERRWIGRHASGASAAGIRSLNRHPAEIALTRAAIAQWYRIAELVGDDCGFDPTGQIRIARQPDRVRLEERLERLAVAGWSHEKLVEGKALRRLLPDASPHYVAGLYVADDGSADPHRTIMAFRAAAEVAGVQIFEGCSLAKAQRESDGWRLEGDGLVVRAGAVVNVAGAWLPEVAQLFGEELPLGTKASMMIVTERVARMRLPVVGVVGRPLSFKQTRQGTLLLGGGLQGSYDLAAERAEVRVERLAEAARTALDIFPMLGKVNIVRTWAGLEGATPDHLPVIGPSARIPGLWHVGGFTGHGFALVPVVGRIIADLVVGERPEFDLGAFSPARLQKT